MAILYLGYRVYKFCVFKIRFHPKNHSDFLYKKYLYNHLFSNIFSSFIHFSSEKLLKKDLSFRKIDIFADDKVAQ